MVVDAHEAAVGQLHARGLQAEAGGDGGAPQGDEQVGSAHLVPVSGGDNDAVPVSRGGDLRGECTGQNRDPQGLQAGSHLSGDVLVLAVQDVRPSVDDGDRDSEEPHEGGHLDADDTAAQDDEATGQLRQGEQVLAGPVAHVRQALDRGNGRRGTGVDEDLGAADAPQAAVVQGDLDGALPHETCGSLDEVHAGGGEHLLVGGHHASHDGLLAGAEGGQLDAGLGQGVGAAVLLGQGDAVGLRALDLTKDAGGGDEGLGGDAGDVDAGAAHLVPLHHDDLVAGLGAQHRQGLSCLAASDDEKVNLLDRDVCLVGRVAVDGGLGHECASPSAVAARHDLNARATGSAGPLFRGDCARSQRIADSSREGLTRLSPPNRSLGRLILSSSVIPGSPTARRERPGRRPASRRACQNSRQWVRPWQSPRGRRPTNTVESTTGLPNTIRIACSYGTHR